LQNGALQADDSTYSLDGSSLSSGDLSSYLSASGSGTGTSASDSDATGTAAAASSSASTSTMVSAFSLSTQGTLSVSVSVDELDINSMEVGQEATISLDAIEDQTFTGSVSSIANTSSSSSNGVAKYTVKLTLTRDDSMKPGMNASVSIVTSESKDVLTLPVAALQERGDECYVYTQKDEDGNLSGEVTVTTGLSDGTNVEITDGLTEGTTVYYQKTSSSDSDSMSFDMGDFDMSDVQFDAGNGGMQGADGSGGNGGDMPSGDFQGGGPSGDASSGGGQ
jgi:multidrug efflux pump subunit AcrA (membrane-fusion protein)